MAPLQALFLLQFRDEFIVQRTMYVKHLALLETDVANQIMCDVDRTAILSHVMSVLCFVNHHASLFEKHKCIPLFVGCHVRWPCELRRFARNRASFLTSFRCGASYVILHMITLGKTMAAVRASFTIAPEVLLKFNEMVPAGERSQVIQSLMQRALAERQKRLEAIAEDFDTQ